MSVAFAVSNPFRITSSRPCSASRIPLAHCKPSVISKPSANLLDDDDDNFAGPVRWAVIAAHEQTPSPIPFSGAKRTTSAPVVLDSCSVTIQDPAGLCSTSTPTQSTHHQPTTPSQPTPTPTGLPSMGILHFMRSLNYSEPPSSSSSATTTTPSAITTPSTEVTSSTPRVPADATPAATETPSQAQADATNPSSPSSSKLIADLFAAEAEAARFAALQDQQVVHAAARMTCAIKRPLTLLTCLYHCSVCNRYLCAACSRSCCQGHPVTPTKRIGKNSAILCACRVLRRSTSTSTPQQRSSRSSCADCCVNQPSGSDPFFASTPTVPSPSGSLPNRTLSFLSASAITPASINLMPCSPSVQARRSPGLDLPELESNAAGHYMPPASLSTHSVPRNLSRSFPYLHAHDGHDHCSPHPSNSLHAHTGRTNTTLNSNSTATDTPSSLHDLSPHDNEIDHHLHDEERVKPFGSPPSNALDHTSALKRMDYISAQDVGFGSGGCHLAVLNSPYPPCAVPNKNRLAECDATSSRLLKPHGCNCVIV